MVFRVPRIKQSDVGFRSEPLRTLAVAVVALFLFAGLGMTPANAQFFFDYGYQPRYVVKKPKPVRRSPPVAATYDHSGIERGNKTKETVANREPDGPVVVTVSLRRQRVSVWDRHGLMMEAPISSGQLGHPTPTGVYSILEKNREHYSNLYDSAPMPNMQRITWSGVALHAGVLPGYPASHGCIRLPRGFSQRLFDVTQMGTRVIVAYDPVQPVAFEHPTLFASYPETSAIVHAMVPGETRVADASDLPHGGAPTEVGSVISVSTALASQTPPPFDAIDALRAERRADMDRLAAAVVSLRAEKATAVAAATDIVKGLEGRKLAVRNARVAANGAAADARLAAPAAAAANVKLDKFAKSLVRKTAFTPEDVKAAQADEDRLETAALDLADAEVVARTKASAAAAALVEAERVLAEADKDRVAAANLVRAADDKLDAAVDADAAAKRREAKRKQPVHVFISRKTQKVYVRQGYEPILEAPITIDRPDEPMGTHVFTALAVDPTKADVTWSVASIASRPVADKAAGGAKKDRAQAFDDAELAQEQARRTQTADAALQRIDLPANVRLQIEDVMKPGSSLIVSDHGLSSETGVFTDFIVPLR